MLASKAMAITFALSLPSLSASLSIRQSGGDVTILTTFQIDQSCDGEHKKFIEQGHKTHWSWRKPSSTTVES
jgi:hypothetical protein